MTERAGPVRIYSVHLSHLSPATRLPQVEALLDIHARAERRRAWCGGHPDPAAGWTGRRDAADATRTPSCCGDFNFDWDAPRVRSASSDPCERARYGRLNRLDRIRRRLGRSRTSGRRRRDNSRGEADRLLPGFRDARASRPVVVVDRRQRNRIRSLSLWTKIDLSVAATRDFLTSASASALRKSCGANWRPGAALVEDSSVAPRSLRLDTRYQQPTVMSISSGVERRFGDAIRHPLGGGLIGRRNSLMESLSWCFVVAASSSAVRLGAERSR